MDSLPKPESIKQESPSSQVSESSASETERERSRRRTPRVNYSEAYLFERSARELAKKALQEEDVPDLSYKFSDAREVSSEPSVSSGSSWKEPPLAEPISAATGLPLGALPSRKIKKEALWPRRKSPSVRAAPKVAAGSEASVKDDNDDENVESDSESVSTMNENVKAHYIGGLKTNRAEALTRLSVQRLDDHEKLKPIPKKGSEKYTQPGQISRIILKVPSTPKKSDKEPRDQPSKKIKKSPVKRRGNAFGYGAPDLSGQKRAGAFDFDDSTRDNDDFCSTCGGTGIFLCCEACPKSFHFVCCDPPLDEASLPDGNWYCNECSAKRRKLTTYDVGIFSKLLNATEKRNPRKFQLPKRLRESTFENVSTGPNGEYQDASVIKNSRPVKLGRLEEAESANIFDKEGNPLICYKCGQSGLTKPITRCGYCDLSWHLDCLNPPLSHIKTLGTKWKCPNHVSDLVPDRKRRLKKAPFVDVSMSRGFKNNGDVEILEEGEGDDVVKLPVPDFFKSYYQNGEVRAKVGDEMEKLISVNNITYRIPERGIILDFIDNSKIKKLRELKQVTADNDKILTELKNSNDDRRAQYVESLSDFHDSAVIAKDSSKHSFQELLNAVNKEAASDTDITSLKLDSDELTELKYLKKLIEIKGKDKLMEFLKS